jgi:serine/threonine protein kinase
MEDEPKRKIGKYEIGEVIGEGSFGEVMEAVHLVSGEKVAIKELDKDRVQDRNMGSQLQKEISILKKLKHAHIVQLKEVLASRTSIFMVLEYVGGGDLHSQLSTKTRFDEDQARALFAQLIAAVQFCHDRGVCHRDLKPENILIDDEGKLKLADFGLADLIDDEDDEDDSDSDEDSDEEPEAVGTLHYIAPEAIEAFKEGAGRKCDVKKVDTWACGVVLYVLLAGYLPFEQSTKDELLKKIQKMEFAFPTWFSPEAKAFISKFMAGPADRITLSVAAKHPWMQKADPVKVEAQKVAAEKIEAQKVTAAKGGSVEVNGAKALAKAGSPENLFPDELKQEGAVSASKILKMAKAAAEGGVAPDEMMTKAAAKKPAVRQPQAMDKNDNIFAAFEAKMDAKKAAASTLSRLTGAATPGAVSFDPSHSPLSSSTLSRLTGAATPGAGAAASVLSRLMPSAGGGAGKKVVKAEGPPKNTLAEGETSKDFFAAMEARLKPKLDTA